VGCFEGASSPGGARVWGARFSGNRCVPFSAIHYMSRPKYKTSRFSMMKRAFDVLLRLGPGVCTPA